jgi:uncharacterized OB-fold protein
MTRTDVVPVLKPGERACDDCGAVYVPPPGHRRPLCLSCERERGF